MSTTQRRTMGALVAGLAAAGLAALATVAPAGAAGAAMVQAEGPVLNYTTASPNPLAGVTAKVRSLTTPSGRTIVTLHLAGFAEQYEGTTFGAHAHTGPCSLTVSAGPHYTQAGTTALEEREVWLDFTVDDEGHASAQANRDWVFAPNGANSVVVHALPTASNGVAGARLGCLAVDF